MGLRTAMAGEPRDRCRGEFRIPFGWGHYIVRAENWLAVVGKDLRDKYLELFELEPLVKAKYIEADGKVLLTR